ncbi:hypothetical protein C8R43DRAFT_1237466 [Mycena crocata]|nr:hypothetical protein C8R43DRAFT_1237466 [Mycena crocata]
MYWNGITYTEVPIWERTGLRNGDNIPGPAIITEPWGVNGGEPGQRSSKTLVRASDGARIALPSKADFIAVREGDVLEWRTWGGGGYDAPYECPVEIVAREAGCTLDVVDDGREDAWRQDGGCVEEV